MSDNDFLYDFKYHITAFTKKSNEKHEQVGMDPAWRVIFLICTIELYQ